jgi:hypothetical protein
VGRARGIARSSSLARAAKSSPSLSRGRSSRQRPVAAGPAAPSPPSPCSAASPPPLTPTCASPPTMTTDRLVSKRTLPDRPTRLSTQARRARPGSLRTQRHKTESCTSRLIERYPESPAQSARAARERRSERVGVTVLSRSCRIAGIARAHGHAAVRISNPTRMATLPSWRSAVPYCLSR